MKKSILIILVSLLNISPVFASEKILLQDKFDDNMNSWIISRGNNFKLDIKNGILNIENKTKNSLITTTLFPTKIDQSKDFEIKAEIKKISGLDNNSYDLVWGFVDKDNFYSFGVSGTGAFRYGKYVKGIYKSLVNWTSSSFINKKNAKNKLALVKSENKIYFYCNHNLLGSSTFEKFIGNKQGIMLQTKMTVQVDNFLISEKKIDSKFKELMLDIENLPPEITIFEPDVKRGFEIVSRDELIKVRGKVKDIDGIAEILVNGVDTKFSETGDFDTMIKLNSGENKINVSVKDKNNSSSNKSFEISYKKDNPTKNKTERVIVDKIERSGKDYALLFATDKYDYWNNLTNPVNDAFTIKNELKDNYGFEAELVENPTKFILKSKLREYAFKSYNPDDQLFIFIAGHGQFDSTYKEGYIVTKDSLLKDEIKDSYISHSELSTIINNINCKHIFLVMDVCFGGTFDQRIAQRGEDDTYKEITKTEFIQRKMKNKTRLYLTSGGKEYVPDGRAGQHSPFARKFIEALRSYGGSDGVLTQSKLNNYLDRINPEPRYGEFGNNEPGSDFIFVTK